MLCDLVTKALPAVHFWKCYCAAQSLGQGHVQKLHTSNKDLLLEKTPALKTSLHLLTPHWLFFYSWKLYGCQKADLTGMELRSLSGIASSDSVLPCNMPKKPSTWKWAGQTQTHSAQGCLQNRDVFRCSYWDSLSWADEMLWSGGGLWMTMEWTFGDSSNVHTISLR